MRHFWLLLLSVPSCAPAAAPIDEPAATAEPSAAKPKLTAISGELPGSPPVQLDRHEVCGPSPCVRPSDPADGAPATMWSQQMDPGAVIDIPAEADRTTYGLVLSGRVLVDERDATAWHAFRAPKGVKLTAAGAADLVLASVRGAYAGDLEVVDVAGRPDLAFAAGSSHVRIVFEDGPASLQIMLGSKDAPVPRHQHPKAWEVIGLLQASGTFSLGADAAPTKGKRILAIPPATEHAWKPAGDTPMIGVQLYVPPGPEQRFKQLAGVTK